MLSFRPENETEKNLENKTKNHEEIPRDLWIIYRDWSEGRLKIWQKKFTTAFCRRPPFTTFLFMSSSGLAK